MSRTGGIASMEFTRVVAAAPLAILEGLTARPIPAMCEARKNYGGSDHGYYRRNLAVPARSHDSRHQPTLNTKLANDRDHPPYQAVRRAYGR